MSSKRKDPAVRRKEIIDIAETLFDRRGYEATSVSQIVKRAGVAQGTFYHYFDSKEELLFIIADRFVNAIVDELEVLVAKDDLPAIDKMFGLFGILQSFTRGREGLIRYFHEERNAPLHGRIQVRAFALLIPLFRQIIEQGEREGVFRTEYPEEAALAVFSISAALFESSDVHDFGRIRGTRRFKAFLRFSELILRTPEGFLEEAYSRRMGFE